MNNFLRVNTLIKSLGAKTVLALCFGLFCQELFAINYTSAATGNWNSATTWSPVGIPSANDQVTLNGLYTVTITGTQTCSSITVTGALSNLTINSGGTLTVGANFTQVASSVTHISTVNVNGTLNVGGNLLLNYSYLLAVTSSNTFNIGNATTAGTLNVTGNIQFTSSTTVNLSQRNLIRHNQGTVNLGGNMIFSSTGQGAGVQGYIMDDNNTFDGKAKRLNIKGTFVNLATTSFVNADANGNSPAIVNYNGTAEQSLVSTNITYQFLEISNPVQVILINTFPSSALLKTLTIKSGGVLNLKAFRIDNISDYAGQIQIENNGVLRIEDQNSFPAQKKGGDYVMVAASSGIVEYYTTSSIKAFKDKFPYPIVRLTGSGVKFFQDEDIDNDKLTVNRIELIQGTFEIKEKQKLQLSSTLNKMVVIGDGTTVNLLGDFKELDAFFTISPTSTFKFRDKDDQTVYSLQRSIGLVEAYGNVVLDRETGDGNFDKEILAGKVVKIRGKLSIFGKCDFDLNQGSILELSSDANYTGYIGEIPATASINYLGNPVAKIVARKYVSFNDFNYRDFASPMQSSTLLNLQKVGIYLTGIPGSLYPNFNFINAYYYDESLTGDLNSGFVPANNVTNTMAGSTSGLITRAGWRIYTGGNPIFNTTLSDTGYINQGTLTYKLTYTRGGLSRTYDDGWNFIGNQYPSAISWSAVYNDPTNAGSIGANGMKPTVYVWKPSDRGTPNNEEDSYGFYNAVTGIGTALTNSIPSFQGFWVQTLHTTANAASWNLAIKESHKTDQQTTTFFKDQQIDPNLSKVTVSIVSGDMSDEIWFHPFTDATTGLDEIFDVQRFGDGSIGPQINFSKDGESLRLWVNAVSKEASELTLPIEISTPDSKEFSLELTNIQGFTEAYGCLQLIDQASGLAYNLSQDTKLDFVGEQGYVGTRFIIKAYRNIEDDILVSNATCFGFEDGNVMIDLTGYSDNSDFELFKNGELFKSYTGSITEINEPLGSGAYELVNKTGRISCTSSKFNFNIDEYPQVVADFVAPAEWRQNSFVPIQNKSTGAIAYTWEFSDVNARVNSETPYYYFEQPGVYTISLLARNQYGCESTISTKEINITSTTGVSELDLVGIKISDKTNGISIQVPSGANATVNIFSLSGQLLKSQENVSDLIELSLARTNQMVLVQIEMNGKSYTSKLIH